MKNFLFILLLCLNFSCAHKNKEVIQNKIESHPVGNLAYWSWVKNYNLETKIYTKTTEEVNEYLKLWKQNYDLKASKNHYPSDIDSENFEHVFRYAILKFPREYKIRLNTHIKALYLVKNLGISTMAIQLNEFEKENSAQFLVFMDVDVINQKINDWYKWREESAFKNKKNYELSPYLSHENTVVETIHYTLFQLYGIVLNWNPKFYPTTNKELLTKFESYPLLNESWKLENEIVSPKFTNLIDDMNYIAYYDRKNRIYNLEDMVTFHDELEKTNYPNLFAFSSSSKDFVESIANYLHVHKMNRPFSVDIKKNGKIVQTLGPCWTQSRCLSKRKTIERVLKESILK